MFSRPRPVLTSAGIAGGVTALAGVLTFLGYDSQSAHLSASTTTITSVVIGAVSLGSHLWAASHGQDKVTPLSDPRDANGNKLVPETSLSAFSPLLSSVVGTVESSIDKPADNVAVAPVEAAPAHAAPDPIVIDAASDPAEPSTDAPAVTA